MDDAPDWELVDDVAHGARIVCLRDGHVDQPDAELPERPRPGSAALATGPKTLKIPIASERVIALIDRRMPSPVITGPARAEARTALP